MPRTDACGFVERDPFVVRRCRRGSPEKGQSEKCWRLKKDGRPASETSYFADEPITAYVGQLRPHGQWYHKVKFHKKVEYQGDGRKKPNIGIRISKE